ncbi:hypothetical protein [Paenibacillus sp. GSMTC-2017]|nr:hypothetical protein [Paenibacillus sp. GSMTC-2017]
MNNRTLRSACIIISSLFSIVFTGRNNSIFMEEQHIKHISKRSA